MRQIIRFLLLKPILWIIESFTSDPDRDRIFSALTELRAKIIQDSAKKGFVIPFEHHTNKFIIFSDQHKGRKNGADDFMVAEPNYVSALSFYNDQGFHLISLGDSEELWENTILQVKKNNEDSFAAERKFVNRHAFTKVFGNHDLDWQIDPLAPTFLKEIYGKSVPAFEGIILQTRINNQSLEFFCTHGHQGDKQSDGNWFSKFFVAKIWAPLQSYLRIYPNTPAYDSGLKSLHNRIMYEWSESQHNLVLITGHTHQPVFASLTHIERLQRNQQKALRENNPEWANALENEILWRRETNGNDDPYYLKVKSSYFNSGCCCFSDGDITGIEIADGAIRLIKWKKTEGVSNRQVLEEMTLQQLVKEL
jgi:predicted phosphodiesterase